MSDEPVEKLMRGSGVVRRERPSHNFGKFEPSRGWYIVIAGEGIWYLHHDGKVKKGVNADSEKPAFWPTKEDAESFFGDWKATQ